MIFLHGSVACSAATLGFIQATLEPHLRDFNLSPLQVGAFFVISGATYGEILEPQMSIVFLDNLGHFSSRPRTIL